MREEFALAAEAGKLTAFLEAVIDVTNASALLHWPYLSIHNRSCYELNNFFAAYHMFVVLNEAMESVVEADPTVLPAAMSALPSDQRMNFFVLKDLFGTKDLGAPTF